MNVIQVRNVNQAYVRGAQLVQSQGVLTATRAGEALVVPDPVTTVYEKPQERVLFNTKRDANPFFHFFEALWILNGQQDVETLSWFNQRMAEYSDNGKTFHAAYGYRLRKMNDHDQLLHAIDILRNNHASRQVMLQIWNHDSDLGMARKDIPCNDMIKLRIVNGKLDLMVFCRSNDMIWGAYGANAVQFSTLQEFIAGAVGVPMGKYYQISCDFHAYKEVWEKSVVCGFVADDCAYSKAMYIRPFDMFYDVPAANYHVWLAELEAFMECVGGRKVHYLDADKFTVPYLKYVATPLLLAWSAYKRKDHTNAQVHAGHCQAQDWNLAAINWLSRRNK